jgi:hypothetical protein
LAAFWDSTLFLRQVQDLGANVGLEAATHKPAKLMLDALQMALKYPRDHGGSSRQRRDLPGNSPDAPARDR